MNVVNQPLTGESNHADVRMKEMRSLVALASKKEWQACWKLSKCDVSLRPRGASKGHNTTQAEGIS